MYSNIYHGMLVDYYSFLSYKHNVYSCTTACGCTTLYVCIPSWGCSVESINMMWTGPNIHLVSMQVVGDGWWYYWATILHTTRVALFLEESRHFFLTLYNPFIWLFSRISRTRWILTTACLRSHLRKAFVWPEKRLMMGMGEIVFSQSATKLCSHCNYGHNLTYMPGKVPDVYGKWRLWWMRNWGIGYNCTRLTNTSWALFITYLLIGCHYLYSLQMTEATVWHPSQALVTHGLLSI